MDDYGDNSKRKIQPAVTKKDITLISYFFLSFLNKLFKVANERTLTFEDLGTVFYGQPGVLGSVFMTHYLKQRELFPEKRSFWPCVFATLGYRGTIQSVFLFAFSAAVQLGPVLILSRLVNYLQGVVDYSKSTVWIMVALLFVLPMVSSFALAHSNTTMLGIAAVARNMLVAALYRKSLTISAAKKLEISTGRILTLYSEDSKQILSVVGSLHTAVLAPFQIATCLYLIYRQVGISMFVGLGYSVFVMPVTGVIFEYVFQIRKEKMDQSDIRVKFMNDVLHGIRVVKYYALENAFIKKISAVREKEVHLIRKMGYLYNIPFGILLTGAPNIQTVLIFLTFICIGRELDVSTAFTTITLMGIMAAPFSFLPTGIQAYSQSLVAMDRIMHFLDCEDVAEYINRVEPGTLADSAGHTDVVIQFQDVSVAWSPVASPASSPRTPADKAAAYETVATSATEGSTEMAATDASSDGGTSRATHTLVDLNLSIRKGELVGIVGSVGGGHSSLLNAVLGEMNLRCGTLSMVKDTTIAYCDQRPWIMNATVRDNITFGKTLDDARLERAIYVCGMKEGLREREGGLDCEIGEHGTNISGGQRARVSLARAVYSDADIYLLDDPLSAMDALVGEHIFQKCIKEELKGKTVLLVTHDLHVLPQCDRIVILDDEGGILRSGTYEQIMRSGVDVKKYLIPVEGKNKVKQPQKVDEAPAPKSSWWRRSRPFVSSPVKSTSQRRRPPRRLPQRIPWQEMVDAVKNSEKDGSLTKDEEMRVDGVPWSTYGSFISAGGVLIFVLVILAQLGGQVLSIYANFWLTNWGANTRKFQSTYLQDMPLSRSLYWYNGYAGTLMASVALVTFSRTLLMIHRTAAARKIHASVLQRVMFFPMAFFDVTPIGRVINRFSQDMSTVDEGLAGSLSQLIGLGGSMLGAIAAISASTKGTFLILLVFLALLYWLYVSSYRKANLDLARLASLAASPIFSDFSHTLSGTSTIRAYRQSDRFLKRMDGYLNVNTMPGAMTACASQWLSIRLDFLGALVIFFTGVIAITTKDSGFISPGYLALSLSYAVSLTSLLKGFVRVVSSLEAKFIAVERIHQYTYDFPSEDEQKKDQADRAAQLLLENSALADGLGDVEMNNAALLKGPADRSPITPPENWPERGQVEFVDVVMRYRDGPPVLKGVSFKVNSHDHVDITGRAGCGKSSLTTALYRMGEYTGTILIDGIDTSRIPLKLLRSKLCIVPQDPVMFCESVRFNLDPFEENTDEAIWEVLDAVDMKEHVLSLSGQLDEQVAEGGGNLSVGQRQLICIGRALLRKPRILVMDEATASVDVETDKFIQSMIRQKFKNVTLVSIAHRLNALADSTRVLVMEAGLVAEYDEPEVLLNKEGGLFKGLCDRLVSEGDEQNL